MKELLLEADRCLLCKNARCQANCPISTEIPEVVKLFKEGNLVEAGEILFVGSNSNGQSEHVYKYSDGTVVLVSDDITNCNFININ